MTDTEKVKEIYEIAVEWLRNEATDASIIPRIIRICEERDGGPLRFKKIQMGNDSSAA